jgi:hypothetical protein
MHGGSKQEDARRERDGLGSGREVVGVGIVLYEANMISAIRSSKMNGVLVYTGLLHFSPT